MAFADILAAMEAEATAEETRLSQEAHEESARLVRIAVDEVATARQHQLHEAATELQAARARLEATVRLHAAAQRAEVRDALVEMAFARARESLATVRRSDAYPPALHALLREALEQFPPGEPVRVRCDPRDTPLVKDLLQATNRRITLDSSLGCWGGVLVEDATGEVVADNTLERRLERARERLWPEVASLLLRASEPSAQVPVAPSVHV